ncbi:hypothetical protein TNCV_1677971 [Trichonephila clavipes]|nr:hypothetical protein TNCV_1677971 [Trichonephila clavipes]
MGQIFADHLFWQINWTASTIVFGRVSRKQQSQPVNVPQQNQFTIYIKKEHAIIKMIFRVKAIRRLPSGPISLLKEVQWVEKKAHPTTLSRSVEKYLEDLIERLRKAHEIAAETGGRTQIITHHTITYDPGKRIFKVEIEFWYYFRLLLINC